MIEDDQRRFAAQFRISFEEYKLLVAHCTTDEVITCLEILKATTHKSSFRASMEQRIRDWLLTAVPTSKPMTPQQFRATAPAWPIKYRLPV